LSAAVNYPDGITYYHIDGPFCPGMSGSGVYNLKGELVGMIMMSTKSTEEMMMTTGLIVPVHYFKPLICLARKIELYPLVNQNANLDEEKGAV
ncbi:MAG: hypothetical protein ACP5IX_03200, partial [Patescibacteria group bacterium]